MKNLYILILTLLSYNVFSQSLLFIGEKSYPSTGSFYLKTNLSHGSNLNVTIAKKENGGIICLETSIFGGNDEWCLLFIRGKTIIYLDDGDVISLLDRGIYDSVDNTASTIYYLTETEIEKLKKSNIHTIRYSIKPKDSSCTSSESGNFSASNVDDESTRLPQFNGPVVYLHEKVNVPDLVKALFK